MKKNVIIFSLVIALLAAVTIIFWVWWTFIYERVPSDTVERFTLNRQEQQETEEQEPPADSGVVTSLAEGLEIPWSLVFLPDNSILLTERPGRVRLIDENGLQPEPVFEPGDVLHIGEGGLLGIVLHPEYESNSLVYLYYTYGSGEDVMNKVVRYTYDGDAFTDPEIIIDEIPGAQFHNGGRIEFGPDGMLYITAGDALYAESAQSLDTLSGKILRMTPDGEIPDDNPFEDSFIYSYGHRNPQGLAWDDSGRLWSTEHGRTAKDEVNSIEAGNNYGWPDFIGDETAQGITEPFLHSGSVTWAPSGAAIKDGSFYFAGLRGQTLYELDISEEDPVLKKHFEKQFGRLRAVVLGPDGFLYVLTSNRDGRGVPLAADDRVLRIDAEKL